MDTNPQLTIGELARRTGLSVRTVRFYSDAGIVPESDRSPAGYRLYDVEAVTARVRRAVLRALVKKASTIKDVELMNKLARLSAEERNRIIAGFYDEVFGGLDIDPEFEQRLRSATPDLPDDPSPEQVEAWIELAELVADPGFRVRVRQMAEGHSEIRQGGGEVMPEHARGFEMVVAEQAGAALAEGVDPASAEAAAVLVPIMDALRGDQPDSPELRAATADRFESGNDRRVERYWQLLGVINGWGSFPSMTPAFEWTIAALRAHPAPPVSLS